MNTNTTPAEDAAADYAKCETPQDIVHYLTVVQANAPVEYFRKYVAEFDRLASQH